MHSTNSWSQHKHFHPAASHGPPKAGTSNSSSRRHAEIGDDWRLATSKYHICEEYTQVSVPSTCLLQTHTPKSTQNYRHEPRPRPRPHSPCLPTRYLTPYVTPYEYQRCNWASHPSTWGPFRGGRTEFDSTNILRRLRRPTTPLRRTGAPTLAPIP